ncbi:MAG: phosphoribosylglycinamide formyltransferase [Bacteroidota bacterium]|nr:phosphoribosylglycinamide formyltransferase [Bacteroidota bacterium]MDP4233501.1 phosphoribosylglycinamide formyltransferase [Bacteroidota bacterium]MDP4243378.1 phosphoribosylglycinamide formyltransferase [Bacteroidota bacterium]MDP4287935.1 phosphoribosylglycinamide formyltransferase [Bacteroidota bacterium]
MLASGRGTNLANIHNEILAGRLASVELAVVISNNSGSGAMEYARQHEIPLAHVSLLKSGSDPARYEHDLLQAFKSHGVEIIALAGYMKRLPDAIVKAYEHRILNVHPALLPTFGGAAMYGRHVHEAVLAAGCKVSGATVHLVTNEYDAGQIVMQKCCLVTEEDTAASLAERVRRIEFELYPKAIDLLACDMILVDGNRARILN